MASRRRFRKTTIGSASDRGWGKEEWPWRTQTIRIWNQSVHWLPEQALTGEVESEFRRSKDDSTEPLQKQRAELGLSKHEGKACVYAQRVVGAAPTCDALTQVLLFRSTNRNVSATTMFEL